MEGVLRKMETQMQVPVQYFLTFEEKTVRVNDFLEHEIHLQHTGYECLNCHQNKPIFRQGFCKKCFFEAPAAGQWIMHPELSQAHLGIEDRNLEYEKQMQLQPHVLYLANSSQVKVGVTRQSQLPTRWIDQGAHQALIMAQVPNRYLAGIGEVALKQHISDKTNWRKMLTNTLTDTDLTQLREALKNFLPQEVMPFFSPEQQVINITYPVNAYPQKVKSLNLLKQSHLTGKLKGIKGQYLIFEDSTVFNVRSHEGFVVNVNVS